MKEIKSTTNYGLFKFRDDNKFRIQEANINRIIRSIKERNLLHLRPILVNAKMEVIDGQNRLKAAERLGVPIYYEIQKGLQAEDIILLNNQKAWVMGDYFNFYLEHRYPEYLKLQDFMRKKQLSLRIAQQLILGSRKQNIEDFKSGKFKFFSEEIQKSFEGAWDVIHLFKKITVNGSHWLEAARFWKALLMLINHENFDLKKFMANAERKAERIGPRATVRDYLKMLESIANGRPSLKIHFDYGEEE